VETWARRRLEHHFAEIAKVTEGSFTFVALNEDVSKRALPADAKEE
jgi:acyl-CoA hydrolase